jgi:hypothetical protein
LKRRAADVERQFESQARRFDKPHHLRDPSLELRVAAREARVREAILKLTRQHLGIVAEKNGADSFLGRADQDRAERAFTNRKTDRRAAAARAEVRRRHPEQGG